MSRDFQKVTACPEQVKAKKVLPQGRANPKRWFINPEEAERIVSAQPVLTWEQIDGIGGSEPWTIKGWPLTRARHVGMLEEWASSEGLWIPIGKLGKIERGRMEHDLFPVEDGEVRKIGKITKGAGFGRHPFCEGKPVPNDVIPMVAEGYFLERQREAAGMRKK